MKSQKHLNSASTRWNLPDLPRLRPHRKRRTKMQQRQKPKPVTPAKRRVLPKNVHHLPGQPLSKPTLMGNQPKRNWRLHTSLWRNSKAPWMPPRPTETPHVQKPTPPTVNGMQPRAELKKPTRVPNLRDNRP